MEHTGSKLACVANHHWFRARILVDLTRTAPRAKAHIEAWCIRHEEVVVPRIKLAVSNCTNLRNFNLDSLRVSSVKCPNY